MFNHNCDKHGHKFEARYNIIPPSAESLGGVNGTAGGVALFIEKLTKEEYIHDICTKCGKIVNGDK